MISGWIKRIEQQRISVAAFLTTFVAITSVRFLLDAYSTGLQATFTVENLPHALLFFGATMLSMAILLHVASGERARKVLNVLLAGWVVVWIPPIVDLLQSRGKGGVILSYIFDAPSNLPLRFVQFFGGSLTYEFTLGLRMEVAAAMILLAAYVWFKTKSWWKTLLTFFITYALFFLYATIPSLLAALSVWDWSIPRETVLDIVYTPRSFFALEVIDPPRVATIFISTAFSILIALQLVLLFFLDAREKAVVFFKNVRGFRFLFQIVAFIAGIILGVRLTGTPLTLGLPEILLLITLFFVLFYSWIFSVLLNDIHDIEIDKISNKKRPLITGLFSSQDFKELAVLLGFLALLASYVFNYTFVTLTVLLLAVSYLYSVPPLRLRRFPLVATFMMAMNVFIALLLVFLLFAEGQAYSAFPRELIALILLLFTIVFPVKDLKDRKGDEAAGVLTLPVLLGEKRGKLATALLITGSFLLIPIFLGSFPLFVLSLGFGSIGFLLVFDQRINERWVFGLYALFMLLTLWMS